MNDKPKEALTKAQIENWRTVLVGTIGPYALLMTDEQVQNMRDRYQGVIDEMNHENQNPRYRLQTTETDSGE